LYARTVPSRAAKCASHVSFLPAPEISGLPVDHDPVLDESFAEQRGEPQHDRGWVAPRVGHHRRPGDLVPEQLGQPVGRLGQPRRFGVLEPIPGRVVLRRQAEVGPDVHHPAAGLGQARDQPRALSRRQGQEDGVDVRQVRGDRQPGARQVGVADRDGLVPVPTLEPDDLDRGMAAEEADQLRRRRSRSPR